MEKANFRDVGFKATPLDNSLSADLCRMQEAYIAGREVKIMSRPFKLRVINTDQKLVEREFVLVDFQDDVFRVLNKFTNIQRR